MLPYKPIYIESYQEIQNNLARILLEKYPQDITFSFIVQRDFVLGRVPQLEHFLQKNNLQWDVGRFFLLKSNDAMSIHIDGNSVHPKFLALNLPLFGCDNSYMHWWNDVAVQEVKDTEFYGNQIKLLDGANKTITHSLRLTSPHLVQVDIPHNAENSSDKTRGLFSLRFKPEPLHLWY
jgi:hypothetical protein